MKETIFTVVMLLSTTLVDSLFGELSRRPTDFALLREISITLLYEEDSDRAAVLVDSAIKYAPSKYDEYGLRHSYHFALLNADSAIHYAMLSLDVANHDQRDKALFNLANALLYNDQAADARKYFNKVTNKDVVNTTLIGNTFLVEENYDSARVYYYRAARVAYEQSNNEYLANSYANIALTHLRQNDTTSAHGMILNSLKYSDHHAATAYNVLGDITGDSTMYIKSMSFSGSNYDRRDSYIGLYLTTRNNTYMDSVWLSGEDNQTLTHARIDSAIYNGDYKLAYELEAKIATSEGKTRYKSRYVEKPNYYKIAFLIMCIVMFLALYIKVKKR